MQITTHEQSTLYTQTNHLETKTMWRTCSDHVLRNQSIVNNFINPPAGNMCAPKKQKLLNRDNEMLLLAMFPFIRNWFEVNSSRKKSLCLI